MNSVPIFPFFGLFFTINLIIVFVKKVHDLFRKRKTPGAAV